MMKIYTKILIILVVFFSYIESISQCVVCVDAPALITCGESATLNGDVFLTSAYEDNFNNVEHGVVFNLSENNILVETNCSVSNQVDLSYELFTFNGTYL